MQEWKDKPNRVEKRGCVEGVVCNARVPRVTRVCVRRSTEDVEKVKYWGEQW